MLSMLRTWLQDMKFIAALCRTAEEIARSEGVAAPGSEHFVLAALDLPDQTAAHAFATLGVDAARYRQAIAAQFAEALATAGVPHAPIGDVPALGKAGGLYDAAPSGQALMQKLTAGRHARRPRPLLAADVLLAAATEQYSVAGRALRQLGIAQDMLGDAARAAIEKASHAG